MIQLKESSFSLPCTVNYDVSEVLCPTSRHNEHLRVQLKARFINIKFEKSVGIDVEL